MNIDILTTDKNGRNIQIFSSAFYSPIKTAITSPYFRHLYYLPFPSLSHFPKRLQPKIEELKKEKKDSNSRILFLAFNKMGRRNISYSLYDLVGSSLHI